MRRGTPALARAARQNVAMATTATIYHNPRCSTSRNTLKVLQEAGLEPTVVKYLETPPSRDGLRKLLDEVDGSIGVSLSASKIRFDLGQAILTSKLIDGTFPDYTRVIPTANDKLLKLDPRSFMEGVDRVSTIATEKTRAVKMALERDKVILSVTSPENGAAAEEVPGDYAAQGFEIGFNSRYLMDILNQIEGDSVEVHLADAAAPTLIRENDKSPALYVLMPMRV